MLQIGEAEKQALAAQVQANFPAWLVSQGLQPAQQASTAAAAGSTATAAGSTVAAKALSQVVAEEKAKREAALGAARETAAERVKLQAAVEAVAARAKAAAAEAEAAALRQAAAEAEQLQQAAAPPVLQPAGQEQQASKSRCSRSNGGRRPPCRPVQLPLAGESPAAALASGSGRQRQPQQLQRRQRRQKAWRRQAKLEAPPVGRVLLGSSFLRRTGGGLQPTARLGLLELASECECVRAWPAPPS